MKTLKLTSTVLAMCFIAFTSCQKHDNVQTSSSSTSESGNFKVRMTDSPGNYKALNVQITGVNVYSDKMGWISLSNEVQNVNVLDLTNEIETVLAYKGNISAGAYSKIMLTFGEQNTLTLNGSAESNGISGNGNATVNLKWFGPKEVIIEIDKQVSAETSADVLLDFQVVQSIKESLDQYIIQPVITEIKDASTGVQGGVEGAAQASIVLSNGLNEYSTYIDANGNFLIRGVVPGTYELIIEPADEASNELNDISMNNVVVMEGAIKQMGTIRF